MCFEGTTNDRSKKKVFLIALFVAIVLSYIFTSMILWTTESRFLTISRYSKVMRHREAIEGKSFAPDQYRFGSYYLVEYIFKHIPLRWYDVFNDIVAEGLDPTGWSEGTEKSVELFFPEEDRAVIIKEIESTIDRIIDSFSPNNLLLRNMLKAAIDSFGWQEYINDIEKTTMLIGKNIPGEFKALIEKDSAESALVNGYVTFRFFFTATTLLLVFLLCAQFTDALTSLLGMSLFAALLPMVAQDFMQAETMLSATVFAGFLVALLKNKSYLLLLLLVLLGCTARTDQTLFAGVIYLLYKVPGAIKRRKWLSLLAGLSLVFIPLVATLLLSEVIYAGSEYYLDFIQLEYNLNHPWAWIYPLIFLAIPLAFSPMIRNIDFFRKTWLWVPPFMVMNYLFARPAEVRLLLPVLIYSVPYVVAGVKEVLCHFDYDRDRKGGGS